MYGRQCEESSVVQRLVVQRRVVQGLVGSLQCLVFSVLNRVNSVNSVNCKVFSK